MTNYSTSIGLIVFGLFLAIVGGATYSACASLPTIAGPAPNCSPGIVLLGIGLLILVVGIVVAIAGARSSTYVSSPVDPAVPPPLIQPVVVEKTVVKVRCRYCGAMADPTAGRCPSCGAPL